MVNGWLTPINVMRRGQYGRKWISFQFKWIWGLVKIGNIYDEPSKFVNAIIFAFHEPDGSFDHCPMWSITVGVASRLPWDYSGCSVGLRWLMVGGMVIHVEIDIRTDSTHPISNNYHVHQRKVNQSSKSNHLKCIVNWNYQSGIALALNYLAFAFHTFEKENHFYHCINILQF